MSLTPHFNEDSSSMDAKESIMEQRPIVNNRPVGVANSRSSWQSIRRSVRLSRKIQAQLANKIPHNFTFISLNNLNNEGHNLATSSLGSRLLFLGVLSGQRENTLLYVDIPSNHSPSLLDKPVEWKQALGSFQGTTEKYSKEEELLRERKRLSVHGITTYQVSLDSSLILFPAAGTLFTMNINNIGRVDVEGPKEIFTKCAGSRMDPKISPANPDLISFIHENDLWVTHTGSCTEFRLTHVCNGSKSIDNTLSAGTASYVVQEEFDRYTGYWWRPHNLQDKHCILYELVDESHVEVLNVSNPLSQPDIDSFRYPRAGSSNAQVSLRIVEFTCKDGQIVDVVTRQMSKSLGQLFPWMEYIVRLDWVPNGAGIWAQLLNRVQERSSVVYIPISQFDQVIEQLPTSSDPCRSLIFDVEMSPTEESSRDHQLLSDPTRNDVKILYEDVSEVWINVHDTFHFFKNSPPDEVHFIWASEQTGYRHLYLVKSDLKQLDSSKQRNNGDLGADGPKYCRTSCSPLTSGEWEVLEQTDSLWVDEINEEVFFMAFKDSPLESHLYKTSYSNPGSIMRLTHSGFTHTVAMSKACDQFITVSSSINELYMAKVYSLSPRLVALVNVLEPVATTREYSTPELFQFRNSNGDLLHGLYITPPNMEPNKKYPTVLYVYGGPHVQLVSNSFKGLRYQRLYTLSMLGYVVVALDGRGSTHRGLGFESHLKHRMGQIEIEDQVEGLTYLASIVDFVDLDRVAIHGWSYGGYLSLMGLVQRPDIFKVAVAGAPVVCWEHYDTAYTERYMGLPDANPEGYRKGSVLYYVAQFPSEPNRLLVVHGLIDENVHFVHTANLVQALVKNCKPYQLQIYPGERHGIRSPDSNEHFEVAVVSFLQQNL